jgi:hypothetical protein
MFILVKAHFLYEEKENWNGLISLICFFIYGEESRSKVNSISPILTFLLEA